MKTRLSMGFMVLLCGLQSGAFAATSSDQVEGSGITFERVLDLALKNSHKVVVADEQVEAAVRSLRYAERRRLPRIGVQGWFSGDLLEVEEWGSDNLGGYLTFDWDFYQNGAIMQMVAQGWANLASAHLTRRQTVSEIIYTSTALFYDALKAKHQVEIAEQMLKVDDLKLKVVRLEHELGRRTPSELVEAEARRFDSEFSLTRAKKDVEKTILNLRQLTRDNSIEGVSDLPREITWTLDFSVEGALSAALKYQPAVLLAKANVKLATAGEKYAKLRRWPSVRFLTGTDYAFAPLARPREFGLRAGVIVSYPLYDAGDRKSQIEDARAAVKLAELRLLQAQDEMEQQVRDSYADVSDKLDLLRLAEKNHEKVETHFAMARQQYEEHKIDELQMEEIRLQYLQSLQRIESYRLDALLARAKLLRNIGVGSTEQIELHARKPSGEEK